MGDDGGRELSSAVAAVLAEADREIAAHQPVCRASGRCCRFEAWGHRLYVTGVELSHFAFVENLPPQRVATPSQKKVSLKKVSLHQFFEKGPVEGCPYQLDGKCSAREGRPLGCRIYFCDEAAQGWQNPLYEKYHSKLRALHETFAIPYRYMEWRAGLRELVQAGE